MEVVFQKAEIHNFLALGDAEVDFGEQGFVVISGVNKCAEDGAKSNGSGKSSIFDALLWCITGETIRGTKDVSNLYTGDGALVKITLTIDGVEYTILRSKEHSEYKTTIKLFCGDKDISGKGIRDTQEVIQNKLPSISAEILRSVVIFGQGLPDRISNNTPSGRKQVLERLSQSDFMIEDLKNRVSARLKTVKDMLRLSEDRLLEVSTRIKNDEDAIKDAEGQIAEMESALSEKESVEKLRVALTNKREEFEKKKSEMSQKQFEIESLRNDYKLVTAQKASELATTREGFSESIHTSEMIIAQQRQILSASEAEIKKANSVVDVCPTCGQKIVCVFKPDTTGFVKARDEANNAIQKETDKIAEIKRLLTEKESEVVQKYKAKTDEIEKRGKELNEQLQSMKTLLDTTKDEIEKEEQEVSRKESLLSDTSSKLSLLKDRDRALKADKLLYEQKKSYIEVEKEENAKRVSVVSSFNTIVSRDFRGYLLIGVIDYMRRSAQRYATKLFGTSRVVFEQDGNNLNIGYNGKLYENLSGGERQKVDIIMQLAVRDMLCNYLGFSCNILVLDEVTDNLDDEGCRGVMQLITDDLSDIQSVFIISHRVGSLDIPYDKELTVIKNENGVSSIA